MSTEINGVIHEHLGDGVYIAHYKQNPTIGIYLNANSHSNPTDTIWCDRHVVMSLVRYLEELGFEVQCK